MEFFYLLRAIKTFLIKVCEDVFVLLQCLLHRKKNLTVSFSTLGGHVGVFFGQFCGIFFFYFLKAVWFLIQFCTYILDYTLMFVRLNGFMEGCSLAWGYFEFVFFFGGWGGHFQYFSLFFEIGSVCFHENLQRYSWDCCFHFARIF